MTDARTEARWDHLRDLRKHEPSPRHQRRALIDLVGYCHGLVQGGALSPDIEKLLLARVRNVCCEFEMDLPPARNPEVAEPLRTIINSFSGGFGE